MAPSAAIARSARYSCANPSTALSITIAMMAIMSSGSPTTPAMTAATINTTTIVSANCASSMRKTPRPRACCNTFSPNAIVRARTTSALSPRSAELSSVVSACSIDVACHVVEVGGVGTVIPYPESYRRYEAGWVAAARSFTR